MQTCFAIDSSVRHSSKNIQDKSPLSIAWFWRPCKRYLFVLLISIYVSEKREWILFCPRQNVCLAYYLQTNQPKLKNLYLDVPLLFWYFYVGKPDKHHRHIIKVHYLQLVACRWYKLKRAVPKLNLAGCFIWICVFHTDNKLPIWKTWCVPLEYLISKTQKRHFFN